MVVLVHVSDRLGLGGWLGVDVFFVLSGYLITDLLLREKRVTGRIRLGQFYARRAGRLYPALMIAIAIHLVVGPSFAPLDDVMKAALMTSTYTMNFWPWAGFHISPVLLWHTWSLAIEEHFYLAWPLLVIGIHKVRNLLIAASILSVGSLILMATTTAEYSGVSAAYNWTWTRFWELLVGCILVIVMDRIPSRIAAYAPWVGMPALVAAYILGGINGRDTATGIAIACLATVTATTLLIVGTVQAPDALLVRLLSIGLLRWIGEHSYGIYLYHVSIVHLVTTYVPGRRLILIPLELIPAFYLAYLSRRHIEDPIRYRVAQKFSSERTRNTSFSATDANTVDLREDRISSGNDLTESLSRRRDTHRRHD